MACIAMLAMVFMTAPVGAVEERELAPENDPFWIIFSEMDHPTDTSTCVTAVTNYIDSLNIQDENERQGSLQGMTQMCTEIAYMPAEMEIGMAAEGVTSNIFANTDDWHNVENLYFEKAGMGKIQFTNTIDFMSYRFMSFMRNFREMVEFSDGYISLNAAMVSGMKEYGAQLTMYGLDFDSMPDIYVTDANGANMHLATGSDISAASYDPATGELTFSASHFSAFKAVEDGSKLKAMKITKVDPRRVKYNANKNTFRVNVKGKNLFKRGSDTVCTLGFSQATKVHAGRAGKRVKCTFSMSDFSVLGYYPLVISIAGNGEVTKTNAVKIK